jgi:hypothetical protein
MTPMRAIPPVLAHAWAWLNRFTLMNRLLLAMASALHAHPGQRSGRFLLRGDAPDRPYWRFIGLAQLAAAVMLLVPATSTLGALLFLPIGLSMLLITRGVGFSGGWAGSVAAQPAVSCS